MKGGREHRVPLSDRAVGILKELHGARISDFVFPGFKRGQPLSNMALDAVLRRAKVDFTVHGFRSAFRDWAGDSTAFARDVVEAALAHAIENKTEALSSVRRAGKAPQADGGMGGVLQADAKRRGR
jgi:integrase